VDDKYLENKLCFLRDERGATAVEYSIMLVLIILACYLAVGYLGQSTEVSFNKFVTTYSSLTK
jgi:Flp pilus assembly pilin Flp